MATKLLITLALLLFISCNASIVGGTTIKKVDAENRISLNILVKAFACNLDQSSSGVQFIGNTETKDKRLFQNKQEHFIVYENKAVVHCLNSILAMPCPRIEPTPTGRIFIIQYREDFIKTLVLTRKLNCTFRPINFWEFDEPFQGRIL
ncbi:MAG: hypothetical protein SFU98_13340 [Leptospiraceae bacterium]|nr:hypothetical protein [Leptospiraceae bacterium]